jgi:transposase
MSLKPQTIPPIPQQTARVAKAAFRKGNLYLNMRDTFGSLYTDDLFVDLFSTEGSPAQAPWRLALICVMQFAEGLSDRQAADAVRSRIDWKYALSLELTDDGFDYSVLSQFRQRLLEGQAELRLLDTLLTLFVERGLLKAGGKPRTDSTHVLAAVRILNWLELVGETLRHALNTLATIVPDWLESVAPVEWFDRYASRMETYRFPKSDKARQELAAVIGAHGLLLLEKVDQATTMPWLREIEAVVTLRQVWADRFTDPPGPLRFKQAQERAASAELIASPYDTQARYSSKREMPWVGYKVHLSETCDRARPNLITDVQTRVATSADENKLPVIEAALKERNLLPAEHLVDAGYTDAGVLAECQGT